MRSTGYWRWRRGGCSGTDSPGVQLVSLTEEAVLKPGDNIRTGRTGRVLLMRGEETMLISPNSDISLPTEQKDGLETTILQQAGSVLIEAQKREAPHFQVQTPYLAAVVKGTQFRVTVQPHGASVDVTRGQVEVTDFKSGQHALVLPGQAAKVSMLGPTGLSLSGSGSLNPIEQGAPRAPSVQPISFPKGGLSAPSGAPNGQIIHALRVPDHASGASAPKVSALRITSAIGEVKLNFQKVTGGLVGGTTVAAIASGEVNNNSGGSSGARGGGTGIGAANGLGSNSSSISNGISGIGNVVAVGIGGLLKIR